MKIRILDESAMKKVFTMKDAIQADKDALEIYSGGQSDIPLRANISVEKHGGNSLYMYGYAEPANALGVKIVSVYPKNIEKKLSTVPSTMILVNDETGEVNAILDGTYLTRIRTGAVSGAATDILARKESRIFALLGTGGQAVTQLEAVLAVRDIQLVKVYDLNEERAKAFAERMTKIFGNKSGLKILAAETPEEAVQDADIITTVTVAKTAVFDGKLVKKNVHINGVGSYTPDMAEIDEYIVTHADKVYVDTLDGVIRESGDIIQPVHKGLFKESDITGELGDVILGRVPGRESDDEMTYFETTGSAGLDLVTAKRMLEYAEQQGIGKIIEM